MMTRNDSRDVAQCSDAELWGSVQVAGVNSDFKYS